MITTLIRHQKQHNKAGKYEQNDDARDDHNNYF
jgi:hypothetical protein